MINIFKDWISAMLCIGIFITFIQLIIPKTKLKKYIYSLIGIVTILTVVSPLINMVKTNGVEESARQVLENMSTDGDIMQVDVKKYKEGKEEAVKNGFVEGVKKDIKNRLVTQGVVVDNVEIFLNSEYDIEKVEVKIQKLNQKDATLQNVNKVVQYINTEYDIDYSRITVIEEG